MRRERFPNRQRADKLAYMLKALLVFLGLLSLSLGLIGIFLPVLPTTPFLLLSAALFIRSSSRLYNFLISNRLLGKFILNFRKNRGMTVRSKIISILVMWVMIGLSLYLVEKTFTKILLMTLGVIGTSVMGFLIKTSGREND